MIALAALQEFGTQMRDVPPARGGGQEEKEMETTKRRTYRIIASARMEGAYGYQACITVERASDGTGRITRSGFRWGLHGDPNQGGHQEHTIRLTPARMAYIEPRVSCDSTYYDLAQVVDAVLAI